MAERLHLPFPVLSDSDLRLARALRLPTFEIAGMILIKRLTLIVRDGRIEHVFLSGVSAGSGCKRGPKLARRATLARRIAARP
jgi:peroxiredoxin